MEQNQVGLFDENEKLKEDIKDQQAYLTNMNQKMKKTEEELKDKTSFIEEQED